MSRFEAGLDGVTFKSMDCKLLGGFYKAAGDTPRPTAVLLHGFPGIEKHLDIAYALRDLGWNCLYFHFRGCWGSEGSYSLTGLADDTRAAVEWVLEQPSVDKARIALIGASAMGHTALLYGDADPRICAIVGVSPLVNPRTFDLREEMADEFAGMLNEVTGHDLREQWKALHPLSDYMGSLASRAILLVTADKDDLFPPSHYADFVAELPNIQWVRAKDGDHAFSACRPWLARTVTDWLVTTFGH